MNGVQWRVAVQCQWRGAERGGVAWPFTLCMYHNLHTCICHASIMFPLLSDNGSQLQVSFLPSPSLPAPPPGTPPRNDADRRPAGKHMLAAEVNHVMRILVSACATMCVYSGNSA